MKLFKGLCTALLLGITIFCSYKYFSSLKEKYDMLADIRRSGEQIEALQAAQASLSRELESEKAKEASLSAENTGLQEQLRVSRDSLEKMQAELSQTQLTVEELTSQMYAAKAENDALHKQVGALKDEAEAAVREKELLESRLSSFAALKKAIRELKKKVSGARREINGRLEKEHLILGNGGYMLKDGKPTFPARVKIEVVPLPAQTP